MDKNSSVTLENIIEDKSTLSLTKRMKIHLFTTLLEIFKTEISHDSIRLSSKVAQVFTNGGILLQLTTFLWRPDLGISNWKKYEIFWKLISFTRIDLVCGYLHLITEMHFFVFCSLYTLMGLFIAVQILVSHNKKPLIIIRYLLSKGIQLYASILYLPTLSLLLIDLKTFSSNQFSIVEYSVVTNSKGNYLNLVRNITSLVILVFLSFIYEIASVEIRHSFKNKYLLAKASPEIDMKSKVLYSAIIILYIIVYDTHPNLYKFILFWIFVYITLNYLINIPYYFPFINKLKIIASSSEACITLGFLIGYIVNDARTILLFTVFVVPSTAYITLWITNYRYTLLGKINPEICSCQQLEIFLRDKLSSDDNDTEVLTKIDKCLKSYKYKNCLLGPIWQTYYCIDILQDYRLAFIKLSKCWKMPYNLIQDFFIFKCERYLNSKDLSTLEDLSYMRYALIYENLKKRDMELCITLFKFWGELITFGDLKKLNILAYKAVKSIESIRKGYEILIEKYPSSSKCKETYRSFLAEICLEVNFSGLNVNRLNSNKTQLDSGEINYYNENNGMLLVSGNENNLGMIIYANPKFAEILGQNLSTIVGSNINTYIPGKYAKTHNAALMNFVDYCVKADVPFVGSLIFQTETGYLVEVEIRSRCTAIGGNVFFLAMIKKLEHKRHIILLSDKGIIVSYNQKLIEFINIGNFKLSALEEIFPFSSEDLQVNTKYSVNYRGKTIGVIKTHRQVSGTKISVVIIYENDNDMEEVEKKESNDEYEVVNYNSEIENLKKKNFKVGFAVETNFSLHPVLSVGINSEMVEGEKRIEKSTHSSTSTTSASERYSKKILNEAMRGIKVYKFILLIFVLIGVATSLTVLARVKIDLIEENNPSLTMFLGKISNSVISVSVTARIIDLKIKNSLNYSIYSEIFDSNIQNIETLTKNLSEYSDKYWKDCESSDFLQSNIMPVVYLNKTLFYSKINLYDFLIEFNANANFAMQNMKSGSKVYSQELFYVLANGAKFSLDFIIHQTKTSVSCSKTRSNKINFTKNIILFIGISVLCLSIAYVIFFVVSLSRKINDLWSFLSKLSNSAYKSCVAFYTNRLFIINGIEENEISEHLIKENGKVFKFQINFSQIWRYIWRLLIFSGLSISFYLLITLFYCSEIERYIVNRAELILDFTQKNTLLFLLNFYVVEYFCSNSIFAIQAKYPQMNFANSAVEEIDELIKRYTDLRNNIKNNEFVKYMPTETYTSIFESNPLSSSKYTQYGLYSGLEFIMQDTTYVTESFDYNYHDTYTMINANIFQNQEKISILIDDKLKEMMNNTFDIILIATVFYSLISLLLYFCMYIPYLNKEARQLKKIQSLCKLVGSVEKKIEKV